MVVLVQRWTDHYRCKNFNFHPTREQLSGSRSAVRKPFWKGASVERFEVTQRACTERVDTRAPTCWPPGLAAIKLIVFSQPSVSRDKGLTKFDKRFEDSCSDPQGPGSRCSSVSSFCTCRLFGYNHVIDRKCIWIGSCTLASLHFEVPKSPLPSVLQMYSCNPFSPPETFGDASNSGLHPSHSQPRYDGRQRLFCVCTFCPNNGVQSQWTAGSASAHSIMTQKFLTWFMYSGACSPFSSCTLITQQKQKWAEPQLASTSVQLNLIKHLM